MFYSHYWTYNKIATNGERNKVINEIINFTNKLNFRLMFNNKDAPINNNEIIYDNIQKVECSDHWFNTFYLNFNKTKQFSYYKTNKDKEYDLMVSLTLLSLANNIEGFIFSSDENISYWLDAFLKYESYIGPLKISFDKFTVKPTDFYK